MSAHSNASSDEFKEQVRSRTDIAALIAEKVSLVSRGQFLQGLCPFHEDYPFQQNRRPSLNVNPVRQTYKCGTCQEGGDCFSYVMKIERRTFAETLEYLARRAGLEWPPNMG